MYYAISLLMGVLISVMIVFNGGLSQVYGIYAATVIVHIAGLAVISAVVLARREWPFSARYAWFLYMGGAIGVLVTAFTNMAFGRISVSAILALGLLGQSVAGLIIDQYGLLGMPRHPFARRKLVGLTLIVCGIVSMIYSFEPMAVGVSFAAGLGVVISRTLNARLSSLTSLYTSTYYNYLVGLCGSVLVFLLLGQNEPIHAGFAFSPNLYIYLGGVIGVAIVILSNITVARVSAFYLTLLVFVGQVFAGITIDFLISQAFSARIIIGGGLVTAGLCADLLLTRSKS
ncbi:MAG: DMT family transporter [Defluviitaleaceae bacterium]|nr:DMT family transporter [Defluviitaleaceae bacterium]